MTLTLDQIISDAVMDDARSDEASMPLRAVLIVEMMHEDGESYLHTIRPDGTTSWQAVGMVEFAKRWFLTQADEEDE